MSRITAKGNFYLLWWN